MENFWNQYPELRNEFEQENNLFLKTNTVFTTSANIIYTIPVVVHIMHNNGPENISDEQIKSQIEVLNEDFGKYGNGFNDNPIGTDTKIRFCLATKDPVGSDTKGINRIFYSNTKSFKIANDDLSMKNISRWDTKRYCNIWIVNTINDGGILAYAYYATGIAGGDFDGVVVQYDHFGRIGNLSDTSIMGRTSTHEIGHYLNLQHTWAEGDCSVDDGFEDTPNCSGEFYSNYPVCPKPIQCGNKRMIENYMDYSDDGCMNIFTKQQAIKMRETLIKYRATLISEENLHSTGCANCTLCGLPNLATNTISVLPNPTEQYLIIYFDIEEDENLTINIYDLIGRVAKHIEKPIVVRGPYIIDMQGFTNGLFILSIQTNRFKSINKIFYNSI